MSSEIEEYTAAAKNRARGRIAQRIRNDSKAHANVLIETMIGLMPTPEDSVGIYSQSLPRDSYEKALRETNSGKVTILVDDPSNLSWLNELPAEQQGKIKVHKISKARSNHFLFVSSGAFRFEVDHGKATAEANFNEMPVVEMLTKTIESYSQDAIEVFPTTQIKEIL